ncbi:hypothetical protein [Arcobacter peruensis]|uniref:hypothetical protein n=1 Tax=Arcobacter peruensis TaxID=2320140 RepID=UPI000F085921|nr:hypothetical protein [Arcobacter peruensis]
MIFIKFFILFLLSISLYSKEMYFDTISLSKVKKLIKKEEQIAKAYKLYIMEKGAKPISISDLDLPNGFSKSNLFNTNLTLHSTKTYLINPMPLTVKSALYDEYYSNKNRVYTKAPSSKLNENVEIVLSTKEKYILKYTSDITKVTYPKYVLDDKGVLHWYKTSTKLMYSYDDKLIVYPDANFIDDDGNVSSANISGKGLLYPGQKILNIEKNIAVEYINIGNDVGIIQVSDTSEDIGKTVIQFGRSSGGVLINGDIYTWGNNASQKLGLGSNSYTNKEGTAGTKYPVVAGLVRAKVKSYDSTMESKNYFSSPLRPKFIDLFSSSYNSTCGISVDGALYCGGITADDYSFGNYFTHVVGSDEETYVINYDPKVKKEMLYKSKFFNGEDNKALEIFADEQIWIILSDEGELFRWGYDTGKGFSGNGEKTYNYKSSTVKDEMLDPKKIVVTDDGKDVKFTKITYLLTSSNAKKLGALSQSGDIYIWGRKDGTACEVTTWEDESEDSLPNLCHPLKVDAGDISFKSIKGGVDAFIGVSLYDEFYKIYQKDDEKPVVINISDEIKKHSSYSDTNDKEILSVDFTQTGIVWVNSGNELKGDYLKDDEEDEFFTSAIKEIKWKKIKVIEEDNSMCGISADNQMYCWGQMSFYDASNSKGNTFMLPVFNTNLYDLDKDFLVVEGGNPSLTKMTSGDWNSSGNDFYIKYPTYIGGFNYEFEFK